MTSLRRFKKGPSGFNVAVIRPHISRSYSAASVAVGIGGVVIFPVLNIVIRSRQRRTVVARHVIRFTFRCIVDYFS